jgi:hypothetical protein
MLYMNDVLIVHQLIVYQHMLKHVKLIQQCYIIGLKAIVLEGIFEEEIFYKNFLLFYLKDVIDVKNQLKHIMV